MKIFALIGQLSSEPHDFLVAIVKENKFIQILGPQLVSE